MRKLFLGDSISAAASLLEGCEFVRITQHCRSGWFLVDTTDYSWRVNSAQALSQHRTGAGGVDRLGHNQPPPACTPRVGLLCFSPADAISCRWWGYPDQVETWKHAAGPSPSPPCAPGEGRDRGRRFSTPPSADLQPQDERPRGVPASA